MCYLLQVVFTALGLAFVRLSAFDMLQKAPDVVWSRVGGNCFGALATPSLTKGGPPAS